MSSYLRPRRGKNATAIAQLGANAPLKRGEVFFEVPDTGVGTGLGKIKMGDGSTAYANLPYFLEQLDLDNAKIAFTDSNTPDENPYTTNTTLATAIAPTASVKTIFTNLKQLLVNHNAQLTQLNNDCGVRLKRWAIHKSPFNVNTSNGGIFLVTNLNWFDAQRSLTLFFGTSQPTNNKYLLAGNDIYGLTNRTGGVFTITNTASYPGSQYHIIVDISGDILSVT